MIFLYLGMLGAAFSEGYWVYLLSYEGWKHTLPWCRRQKGCSPQSKAQGLAPLPGLAVVFTIWCPCYKPYCSYFPNSKGFCNVSATNSKILNESKEWTPAAWSKAKQSKGIQRSPRKKWFLVRSKWTSFPDFPSILHHLQDENREDSQNLVSVSPLLDSYRCSASATSPMTLWMDITQGLQMKKLRLNSQVERNRISSLTLESCSTLCD